MGGKRPANRKGGMNISILRHGTAEDRDIGTPDAERRLTKEGKNELKAVLGVARRAGIAPAIILTSPLARARETAQIAEAELGCKNVIETKVLLPAVAPAQVWREIRAHHDSKEIMLVGHEPQLSRIAEFLLESPLMIDLKKGSLLRMSVDDNDGPPRGVLKAFLTPKLAGGKLAKARSREA
jgi:phosphohistidine phosphatase